MNVQHAALSSLTKIVYTINMNFTESLQYWSIFYDSVISFLPLAFIHFICNK